MQKSDERVDFRLVVFITLIEISYVFMVLSYI